VKRKPVNSSNIISIGYDAAKKILEIEFKNGIYQYFEVPPKVYQKLMESKSHGKFFYSNIKNAGYSFKKIR